MRSRETYPEQFFTPHNKKKLQVAVAEKITGLYGKELTSADLSDWAVEFSGNLDKVLSSESGQEIKKLVSHDDLESAAELAVVELNKMDEPRERELAKFRIDKKQKEDLSDVA